jgi:hypothetical protein
MARQHTSFRSFKSIASAALAGLGLIILVGRLDGPAALLCTAARETLALLPYFLPFSPCALQMLVSCWPLLRVVAGAV